MIDVETLKKLLQKAQKQVTNREIASQHMSGGRSPVHGWLYDSNGRVYRVLHRVVETSIDGSGPVVASNLPESFRETPGYPQSFQARSLERDAEKQKIRAIARNPDPIRFIAPHVDPTIGAPVVWMSKGENGTRKGWLYVLGGNGRAIAMLMADDKDYEQYDRLGRIMWPEIWPKEPARAGMRHMLVRQVFQGNCIRREMDPKCGDSARCLNFSEATMLAGATQSSLAANETPLGEALSLVRSLGLDPQNIARQMPSFSWGSAIARDTIEDFLTSSGTEGLVNWMRGLLGNQWVSWVGDPDNATLLVQSLMIGFLPRSLLMEGFSTEREERALMAALPFMAQISIAIGKRDIGEEWDLIGSLEGARKFMRHMKGKSFRATMNEIDRMARQENLILETKSGNRVLALSEELDAKDILLGLILKRAEGARDPSIPVESALSAYLRAANQSDGPMQTFLLGRYMPSDTVTHLGRALAESMRGPGAEPIRITTYKEKRQEGMFQ